MIGGSSANEDVDSLDSFMASIGTSLEQEKIDKKKTSLKEVLDELAVSVLLLNYNYYSIFEWVIAINFSFFVRSELNH